MATVASDGALEVSRAVIEFEALTEEWLLIGRMAIEGRLSDALNKRQAIPISDVRWRGLEAGSRFQEAPGLKSVDPYDLIVVLTGEESLNEDDAHRVAMRGHRVPYDVALDCSPFRVIGTVHLRPGTEPDRLLERQTELFVPVTTALTFLGDEIVGPESSDVALVNRSYLRGVQQIDRQTMQPPRPLPGRPLGGTSFRSPG
ncbi:MAG TPA: hypothetical protein VFK38_03585 [Candidatus Limnocylindrales bacterium]|nr:hypothetical protein [Candidatus Limnocylindrales bacterium]